MIKTDIQDLTDITDVKNTRLSDKNGIRNMSYILSKQKAWKEMS